MVVIGLGAQVLFGPNAVADTEMILPFMLNRMFPGWLAALLLAGAVAAMVSTAESMLLMAATSISEDVYKGIIKKGCARTGRSFAFRGSRRSSSASWDWSWR